MSSLRRFAGGLKGLFHRKRLERELDEELRSYLECSVDAKLRSGMTSEDARRAARAELGSIDAAKDHTRDVGWETAAEQLWRDVKYSVRTLGKSPAFAAVVVLTLTLGIGANTAIFSAVNAIMLRELPVERPDELVSLTALYPDGREPFSYAAYRRIAGEGAGLVDALAASTARRDALTIDGPPEPVDVKWVSGNYFTTLGVSTTVGRPLLISDDPPPPGIAVAVISDTFWARRFGRDPAVVGRSVRLSGAAFVVVGVARRGFTSETPGETVDLWMPLSAQPNAPPWIWRGHSTTWLSVLGRRRQGLSLAQVRAGLELVYERVRDEVAADTESTEFRRSVLASRLVVSNASAGVSRVRDNLATPLMLLMGIVVLVLLVACANVANLMLTRAVTRRREMAMCLALGAGRSRLIRQGTLEALLLAAIGGVGGFLLAIWGTSALSSLLSGVLPVVLDISPDGRVLVFAAATSCATAVLFGFLPSVSATALDPLDALKSGGGAGRGASPIPFGRTLVAMQIAVSLVLLVAAGLFVRSLMRLKDVDLGFDPNQVVLFQVGRPADQQPSSIAARRELYGRILERAMSVPGVDRASASFSGVLSSETWGNVIAIEGVASPDGRPLRTFANVVTPAYFDAMRITVLRGRGFTDDDREQAARVAIVNDAFARKFFGGVLPIGKRVGLCSSESCGPSAARMMDIVGVVDDAKYSNLRQPAPPILYMPFNQVERRLGEIQVRTSGDVSTVASSLYRALADVDRRLPIVGMMTARDRVGASLATPNMVAKVASAFGLLALALAAVGLSGLVAYSTTQRTQEIGIRMALGARRRDVRRLVLGNALRPFALGATVGIPAALAVAKLLSGLLYQVAPLDPVVLSLSLGMLAAAALVAGYLPARRAVRVDPIKALRFD
ncbi:MAG TPA: ABC transporter permease [Vicinamibacterales bacterium]|jgi:predicted permease